MKVVEKLWGTEEILWNDDRYCMKVLTLQPGFQSSLHKHRVKHETFLVISGECDMEIYGKVHRFVRGDYQVIPPDTPHRFRAVNKECKIVESSTHHDDDDVIRLEESKQL